MKGLAVSAMIVGIICALFSVILVLSGGKFLAQAEGWARASSLSFLFSICCSVLPADGR